MEKWKWRLGSSESGIWKDVLKSKYGLWRNLIVASSSQTKHYSRWSSNLCKIYGIKQRNNWFNSNVSWQAGFGSIIIMWEDVWAGYNQLKVRFPRINNNSTLKDELLVKFGSWTREG